MHSQKFPLLLSFIFAVMIFVMILMLSPTGPFPYFSSMALLEVTPPSSLNKAPIFRMGLFRSCATVNDLHFPRTTCTTPNIPPRFNFSALSAADTGALEVAIPTPAAIIICFGLVLSGLFSISMCTLAYRIRSGKPYSQKFWQRLTISLGFLGAFLPFSTCVILFLLFGKIVTIFNKSQDDVKFTAATGRSFSLIFVTYIALFATVFVTAVVFNRTPTRKKDVVSYPIPPEKTIRSGTSVTLVPNGEVVGPTSLIPGQRQISGTGESSQQI